MTIALELLARNGSHVRWLDGWVEGSAGWSHPRRGAGGGTVTVPNDHAHIADLREPAGWFRLVRCYLNPPVNPTVADADFLWVINRTPRTRLDPSGQHGEVTQISGDGGLSLLGLGQFHSAVVVDDSGTKVFGWVDRDFDHSGFTGTLTSGGQQRAPRSSARRGEPEGWPDELAEWVWTNVSRTGTGWVVHDLTGYTGTATLFLAGVARAWVDGEERLESVGTGEFARTNLDLDDSFLAVQFEGEAIWTVVDPDDNVLFSSTTGAVFFEAQNEIQSIIVDADTSPFEWGADYPSTGPEQLQGTLKITFRGQTTAGIEYDRSTGHYSAAAVKSALEALSNVDTVTVTGVGTSGSPLIVTFSGAAVADRPHPLMTLDHTDLRHNHATTKVSRVQPGKQVPTSRGGEDAILATFTEPTGVTYGYVMGRLLSAAKNPPRSCAGLQGVTWTFTDTHDSDGNAWDVSLSIVAYRDGVQLGDVALQGTQQFKADCQMLPTLELQLLNTLGTDLSATVQLVEADPDPAVNDVVSATVDVAAPRGTVARIGTEGGLGWAVDAAQVDQFGRRETAATYGTASTVEEVVNAAEALLDDLRGVVPQVLNVSPVLPYDTFTVGDLVGVRETAGGAFQTHRVELISPTEVEAGNVEVDVDLERRL